MDVSLSSKDIEDFVNVKVITYPELSQFSTLKQLLDPFGGVIILYKTHSDYGHWTLLMRTEWGIEFFDSYGKPIDSQLEQIRKNYRVFDGQEYHHLTALILGSGEKHIISNAVPLQMKDEKVQTCGRWCIFRFINRQSDLKSFISLFRKGPISELKKQPVQDYENDILIAKLVKI